MNYIKHRVDAEWGWSLYIMEEHGLAMAKCYMYYDRPEDIYLSSLSVDPSLRRKGIGTELQMMREEIGRKCGAINACLECHKDKWMRKWYERRGYKKYDDSDANHVWMVKKL